MPRVLIPPPWRRKAIAMKILSTMPGGARLLDWARARTTLARFDIAQRHSSIEGFAQMLRQAGKDVAGKHLVEIGSGWHPVLPLVLYGMGAERIVMTDIAPHMQHVYVQQTFNHMLAHVEDIGKLTGFPAEQLDKRWQDLRFGSQDWRAAWEARGLVYRAPFDFTDTGWPSASVDMVYSNSCLPCVPVPVMERIFQEATRLLRPGGCMAHQLLPLDEFSFDPSITPLNFLTYDETTWERIGNSRLHYQNRCRPADYVNLIRRQGLRLEVEERLQRHMTRERLDRRPLDVAFRDLPESELLCACLRLVAKKPVGGRSCAAGGR